MRFIHRVILAVTLCLVSLSPSLLFAQSTVDTALVLAVNGSASGSDRHCRGRILYGRNGSKRDAGPYGESRGVHNERDKDYQLAI